VIACRACLGGWGGGITCTAALLAAQHTMNLMSAFIFLLPQLLRVVFPLLVAPLCLTSLSYTILYVRAYVLGVLGVRVPPHRLVFLRAPLCQHICSANQKSESQRKLFQSPSNKDAGRETPPKSTSMRLSSTQFKHHHPNKLSRRKKNTPNQNLHLDRLID
jgi:hypothetical protein